MKWYPLKLTFHVNTYNFGERLIADRLGKRGLPAGRVAETWEISGYEGKSGAVTNGPLAAHTLDALTAEYPDELVGDNWRGPRFPLLGKFLDASHFLPVHLHADDETARRKHNEPNGKTEAWHILWAEPEATILVGARLEATPDELRDAFLRRDYDSVMTRLPIKAGDTVYVPGGVLHSFGPGTLIFEIQQTSDLAQDVMPTDLWGNRRTFDEWTKKINETLDELRTGYQPRPHAGLSLKQQGANRRVMCCAGPHFALERWTLTEPHQEADHPQRCLTLSNVSAAAVRLEYDGGSEPLEQAESCLVPAALRGLRVVPITQNETAHLIACYVPDLARDVVEPLRAAGYSDERIQELGEVKL